MLSTERQMATALPGNIAGREIGQQVIGSAGSVGVNLEETQATVSGKDFPYKVSLVFAESSRDLVMDETKRKERVASLDPA
jgi:hypothetical protein